jgi:hypothetical protein
MGKLNKLQDIKYNNNEYTITSIKHNNTEIPIILNKPIYDVINKLNKSWSINERNHIYTMNTKNNEKYPVYLHDIVMRIINNKSTKPILHLNNIHFDNRIENLMYDERNKNYSKNTRKKQRTLNLKKYGIDIDNIPTYIWYIKPDSTHGDRFMIDIPNILSWKTTSSKKVSLRYKLEEAKKYLRYIKNDYPDIFEKYSMNGDLTSQGMKLYKEYKDMIEKVGFTMNLPNNNNSNFFLQENRKGLNKFENYLLDNFEPKNINI